MDIFQKCLDFDRATRVREQGLYPYFIPLSGQVGPEMEIDGRKIIMLGSNNYLGLTNHPTVKQKAIMALEKYGTGCTGSRFLNGTLDLHVMLEEKLAEFLKSERVLTFSTGFQTNLGVISTLAHKGDTIFVDRSDHASIIDGTRLSHARVFKFRHNDTGHLRHLLEREREMGALLVVDGVFSMEGDLANLPEILPLAHEFRARVIVDDAHGVGVMGEHGRGTAEHFGVEDQVDILVGTFSKSFASIGGFASGPAKVMDYIQHASRPLIFSASMPPPAVATVLAALEVIQEEPERLANVHRAADRAREGLRQLGYDIGDSCAAPIIPVIIGDDMLTFLTWKRLFEEGVFTNAVISPAVAPDRAMLRTSYMSTHTEECIDRALAAFEKVGSELDLI
ncbi:pyridoxal phosphate-dependent aminotransferase family protein [Candidatus Fermentibacterales bacterium]|nr:pyridoxal phosphate-dependent aminotransferase family protein [Candidatus Fermentibacterales bacterium]